MGLPLGKWLGIFRLDLILRVCKIPEARIVDDHFYLKIP